MESLEKLVYQSNTLVKSEISWQRLEGLTQNLVLEIPQISMTCFFFMSKVSLVQQFSS